MIEIRIACSVLALFAVIPGGLCSAEEPPALVSRHVIRGPEQVVEGLGIMFLANVPTAEGERCTVNVDFGAVTYSGTAVAPDTGTVWNNVGLGATNHLVASDGTLTGVGITLQNNLQGPTNQAAPQLAPDLLKDYVYVLGSDKSTSVTLSGLTASKYDVYVIAQNAVYGTIKVDYTIAEVTKRITNDGDVDSFIEGTNYVVWRDVVPASGEITVSFGDVNNENATSIAGLQLVAKAEAPPIVFQCEWQPHVVQQYDGSGGSIDLQASAQVLGPPKIQSVSWHHHFIYMPEKNRLLLQTGGLGWYSDDLGITWTATTLPDCYLTYLGDGKLLAARGQGPGGFLSSSDYGLTWTPFAPWQTLPDGQPLYGSFGPLLVDKDPGTGAVVRLADACFKNDHTAYVRFSTDDGRTWPEAIQVPWISETTIIRAGNGDLVAATRTDGTASIPDPKAPYDWRRVGGHQDFYSGLGVHISKDNGRTWSPVNKLYESGRHHASMVLMPNNDLVMSYVVRLGYPDTPEGIPRYGIEAVVSHDYGRTWNLNRRYVLDRWDGEWLDRSQGLVTLRAPNETYTVLLPDGSLITAFGTGYRGKGEGLPRDIKLVRWRLNK